MSIVLYYFYIMCVNCTELSCQRCATGSYLRTDQCVACPLHSTTVDNVNATAAIDCVCVSGFTNVSGHCVPCGAAFFKTDVGNFSCKSCPSNTTSSPGSASLESCECVAGYSLTADVCTPCAADTWKNDVGNTGCQACDPAAHAAPGSTRADQCLCNAGYAGDPGATCEACVAGTYRTDMEHVCTACPTDTYNADLAAITPGQCIRCPEHTSTVNATGVASALQCTCNAGYYRAATWSNDWGCRACAPGSYQRASNQSSCELCIAGKYSNVVAAGDDVCEECTPGTYVPVVGSSVCLLCARDTWMDHRGADECNVCPSNSLLNSSGATNISECVCVAGYQRRTNPHRCDDCAAGAFCPGRGEQRLCNRTWSSAGASTCTACAVNSMPLLVEGMTARTQCQCRPGTEGSYDSNCSLCRPGYFQDQFVGYDVSYDGNGAGIAVAVECRQCPVDHFQHMVGSTSCLACPVNATALAGSDAVDDCFCVPGFYSTIRAHNDTCVECPAGYFCEGGHPEPTACPTHTNSAAGSTREQDCICDPGFYSRDADSGCLPCPRGEYCQGHTSRTQCPSNSSSAPRSGDVAACLCLPGTWRGCTIGLYGQRIDEEGTPCTVDYMQPCTACPPDTLCANETLWHCPEHSEAEPGTSRREGCTCEDGYYNKAVGVSLPITTESDV